MEPSTLLKARVPGTGLRLASKRLHSNSGFSGQKTQISTLSTCPFQLRPRLSLTKQQQLSSLRELRASPTDITISSSVSSILLPIICLLLCLLASLKLFSHFTRAWTRPPSIFSLAKLSIRDLELRILLLSKLWVKLPEET